MSFRATHRNARIAPRKARLVADMIRGMNAAEALVALEFSPQRAAWYYKSVLKSAMANAEEQDADPFSSHPDPRKPKPAKPPGGGGGGGGGVLTSRTISRSISSMP